MPNENFILPDNQVTYASTTSAGEVQVSSPPSPAGSVPIAVSTTDNAYKAINAGTYVTAGTGISVTAGTNSQTVNIDTSKALTWTGQQSFNGGAQINGVAIATNNYVASRGLNLVTNGTGLLGNNYNFSAFTFDGSQAYGSNGSFTDTAYNSTRFSDELMPVDPTRQYRLSFYAMGNGVASHQYVGLSFYDADGLNITDRYIMYLSGTTTTLAQDLKNGDTVVYLTDVSKWNTTTGATYQRSIIFWNYKNSYGYTYPSESYSRIRTPDNAWADGTAINTTNNTITLSSAWTGATVPAGTSVSQGSGGGTYKYIAVGNVTFPTTWTKYEGTISGIDYSGSDSTHMFSPGTASVKLLFLNNRDVSGGQVWYSNISFALDPDWNDMINTPNAFSNVTVGGTTISADTPTDTLTLVPDVGVVLTPDATNDKVTIGIDYTVVAPMNQQQATTATTAQWYRVAQSPVNVGLNCARFEISWTDGTNIGQVTLYASIANASYPSLSQLNFTTNSTSTWFNQARIVYDTTYTGNYAYLEINKVGTTAMTVTVQTFSPQGWTLVAPNTVGSIPTGYTNTTISFSQGYVNNGGSGNIYAGYMSSSTWNTNSGDGSGLRFWGSDTYKVYMSAQGTSGWGGRLDSTSDYNMYFRMGGAPANTNRGFVFQGSYNGGSNTNIAQIDGQGNLYLGGSNIYMNSSTSSPLINTISATTPATGGWYRIAQSAVNVGRNSARFEIDWNGVYQGQVTLNAGIMNDISWSIQLNQLQYSTSGTNVGLNQARIVYSSSTNSGTYAYLEVYNPTNTAITINVQMLSSLGWTLVSPSTVGSIPSGYTSQGITFSTGLQSLSNINSVGGFQINGTTVIDSNKYLTSAAQIRGVDVFDTRSTYDIPYNSANWYQQKSTSWDFKGTAVTGLSGSYAGVLTVAPWTDSSGGYPHQLAFNGDGKMYHRYANQQAQSNWVVNNHYTTAGAYVTPVASPNGHYYKVSTVGWSGATEPTWPTGSGATVSDSTPSGTATWVASHAYSANNTVIPTTSNGLYYTAGGAGTSATTAPTWPTTEGATVQDTGGATTWKASTSYTSNTTVVPSTANGYYYVCTTTGTSGATEPTWPTTSGSTVTDGSAVWTAYQIITWTAHVIAVWQEAGVYWGSWKTLATLEDTQTFNGMTISGSDFTVTDGTNTLFNVGQNGVVKTLVNQLDDNMGNSFIYGNLNVVGSNLITNQLIAPTNLTVTNGTSGSVGSNIIANTTYTYVVTACATNGSQTDGSTAVSVTTGATAYPISLSWSASSNAYNYKIYKNSHYLTTVTGTSYTDTGSLGTNGKVPVPTSNVTGTSNLHGPLVAYAKITAEAGQSIIGGLTVDTITASGLITANGGVSGNASTASQLQTARNINLTGAVTGSASFDGSGDITITTTGGGGSSYNPLIAPSSWIG